MACRELPGVGVGLFTGEPFKPEKKGNSKEMITRALREMTRMLRGKWGRDPALGKGLGRASLRDI